MPKMQFHEKKIIYVISRIFFARTFSGLLWYPKIKFWITRTITNINTSLIIRLINSALPYSYNNLARLLLNSFIWRWKIERQNMQWRCWKMKVISRKLFSENYSNYLLTKYWKRSHWIDIVINHKLFLSNFFQIHGMQYFIS